MKLQNMFTLDFSTKLLRILNENETEALDSAKYVL